MFIIITEHVSKSKSMALFSFCVFNIVFEQQCDTDIISRICAGAGQKGPKMTDSLWGEQHKKLFLCLKLHKSKRYEWTHSLSREGNLPVSSESRISCQLQQTDQSSAFYKDCGWFYSETDDFKLRQLTLLLCVVCSAIQWIAKVLYGNWWQCW